MEVEGYKLIEGKRGNRYLLNGKFIKFDDVPHEIRNKLETNQVSENLDHQCCVFCNAAATETRFVQLQTIYMCSEHFYAKNVGQIVQHLKEIYNGIQNKA